MDVSHNFRFRWNDHVPHLSQIFSELRFDEVYCDTTLISDDGFVLKAHGAVLSTTSRYFERVLSDVTADQHPIIVLKGAHFTELSCLLDYIYEGVTQVDQHLMESVLDVADMLEIKGLSKMKNNLSIKKLIAPSPPSSVVSRSSPQCSSPSKSPTPPSHTPRTHSPSCPSSPNESYAPTSAMLKMDSEDANELSDPSQKKRLPFHDPKSSMGTSLMESKEYGGSTTTSNAPNHTVVCPNSEYSDQTLGIDLSLSRPTNEEGERSSVKNFSLHDDTPLRKRKIMKYEEFSPPPNDLEWGKVGEKVKDSMAHKKKRFFTRSVSHVKSSSSRSCSQDETHKTTSHFTLEKLASMLAKDKGEGKSSLSDTSPSRSLAPVALAPKHKSKSSSSSALPDRSESEDSSMEVALDSQVEVLCSDGALTISVTTESAHQSLKKNLNSFNGAHVSLSLKKAKKRYRYRRQVEAVKKENTEERKAYPRTVLKRPNTRFFKRLKSHGVQNQSSHRSESLSVHCDPPFPTEDAMQQQSLLTKDKSPSSLTLHVEEDKSEKESSSREEGGDVFSSQSRSLGKDSEEKSSRGFSCISPLTLFTLPPVKEREKQTRTSLTLEEKIKVIEAFLDGKSQRQIAHLYGIGKTQVNGIVKKREEILSLYRESLVRGEKLTMKRQRKSEYASLNEHLIKWYRHMTVVAGMKITTGMLRAKALQIAPQLGYHDFKASNGWLATFKANHNLKFSRAKKPSESYSNENYDESETQKEGEFFEDEVEEGTDMTAPTATQTSSGSSSSSSTSSAASGEAINVHSVGLHLGTMRGDPDSEIASSGQPPPVGNLTLGNSLLSGSAPLPKPPQMSNMALGTNIAYNLAREHPRSDLTHLSDLHSAPTVNAPPSLAHPPHPTLAKPPDGPLSYKTEDSLSYGYDTQGRMNEGAARGTEYNYTHYGFPGTYYGYHFLDEELAPDCSYNSGASPSECLVYEETRCQRAHSSPCLEEPGLFRHFKKEPYGRENSLEEEIFSCGDEFLQGDSDFYTESDTGGGTTEKEPSHSVNVSSSNLPLPDVLIKQNLYLARSSRDFTLKERSNSGSPTSSRFHGHLKFTSKNDSGSRGESDSCHIWSHPGIVQIPDPKDLFATHKVVDSNNVTDFVSVKISKPNFSRPDVMAKPQPQVQEALRALNTRLKRPTPLIKRPLSKYTLFMKETYPPMAERYPDKKGAEILKIVSTMWRNMTDEEKHPWEERANELQREFRIRHPDYVFCPRTLHAQKQEYDMKRAEKRNLFKINPYIPFTRTQNFH